MLWAINSVLLALITMFWGIGAYSRLNALRTAFTQAFAQIDVQIRQRHRAMLALAEKLVRLQTLEGGALDSIHKAYKQAAEASKRLAASPLNVEAMQDLATTDDVFTAVLGDLLTDATAVTTIDTNTYTDTTATAVTVTTATNAETIFECSEERRSMDNRIAFARQGYNQIATRYDKALQQFPSSVIARIFSFEPGCIWISNDSPIERRGQHRTA